MKIYNILKNLIDKVESSVSIEPSTTTPLIDGTAAVGTENKYARGDHVHPRNASSFYATCSTAASTAAKVVTATGFGFNAGEILCVYFSKANTAATPTLNVNSAGGKSIYIGGSTPSSTTNVLKWSAYTLVSFIFDGTYFRYISSISAANVLSSRGANTWYGTCTTAEATTAKTSAITNYVLTTGALAAIKFTYAVPASVTLNINSTGAKSIFYQGAAITAGIINAGDLVTFVYDGTQYVVVSIDHRRITEAEIDEMFGIASGTGSSSQDYVVEYGTNGIWTYRKWASGIAECWGETENITLNYSTNIVGYLYIPSAGTSVALPSGLFTNIASSTVNGFEPSNLGWAVLCSCSATTTTVTINPIAWNSGGNHIQKFDIFVKGRWK